MYLCYLICQHGLLSNAWLVEKIRLAISLLRNIYSLILNIVKQIETTKPTTETIINATTQLKVEETFQILRSVGEMEKFIEELEKAIDSMAEGQELRQFSDIARLLRGFIKEQIFGIGAKTYQNFVKTQMLLSWRYLQVPPTPFLPPIKPQYKYTIVLDLDETLIFYHGESSILKFRPSLDLFIKRLQSMGFELVSFSASSKVYVDTIISQIERKGRIFQYRLYKEHLSLYQGKLVKDLRRLGRDMSKTLIIDDLSVNFSSCRDNGVEVTSWQGDRDDRQLLTILSVLSLLQKQQTQHTALDLRRLVRQNRKSLEHMLQKSYLNQFPLTPPYLQPQP